MPVSISDHDLVYAVLKLKRHRSKPTFITTRSFKKYQPREAFLRDISLILGVLLIVLTKLTIASMPSISYSMKYLMNMHL